jgi:hypothetical protein
MNNFLKNIQRGVQAKLRSFEQQRGAEVWQGGQREQREQRAIQLMKFCVVFMMRLKFFLVLQLHGFKFPVKVSKKYFQDL